MIGDLTIAYLFLAGAGAGALVAAAVLELRTPADRRDDAAVVPSFACSGRLPGSRLDRLRAPVASCAALRPFFGPAYGAGLAAVLVGMVCLLADLGRPERLLALLFSPTPSYIALGAYLLAALVLCTAPCVARWALGALLPRGLAIAVRVGTVAVGCAVMAYTGLFLASLPAVPFWHSPWLPVLFVTSAASTGLGLLTGAVLLGPAPDVFRTTLARVRRADVAVLAVEAIALAALLASALLSSDAPGAPVPAAARDAAAALLSGALAPAFWLLVAGLGLAVPLASDLLARDPGPRLALATAACLLAGGAALRWCVVRAAAAPDLAASVAIAFGMG